MSAAELSRQIKVPTNRITEIQQRSVTGDTALRLGHFFGASAELWMNLRAAPGRSKGRRRDQGPADAGQSWEQTGWLATAAGVIRLRTEVRAI
ncbi:MAG: helix-turn-helix transcriptional regulator [Gammaproteobacteria bacterium]